MLYGARNGTVKIGDTEMDYICFGAGSKPLVLLPGLGDGIRTVKGAAIPFAAQYGSYAKDWRVYVLSRKRRLEQGCTTRDMARDLNEAMERLGILGASVVGVSQGGMIAQHLAAEYPEAVGRLVLAVSLAKANDTMRRVVNGWIKMAQENDYKGLFIDTAEKSYTQAYLKKYRPLYPLLSQFSKPKEWSRFLIQANACISHDAGGALGGVRCPTLVIGGSEDKIVGGDSSAGLAGLIPGSRLFVYEGLGHGLYQEAKDFNRRVMGFLAEK